MLGDAGLPNDDASYTGEVPASSLSVQYWRDKAVEFQRVLNAVDETARVGYEFLATTNDPNAIEPIQQLLNEYDYKKTALRLAAEGINAGAAAINAAGGRFPQLSIPAGLGIAPVVLGAGAIAALGAAATLISWGLAWIQGMNERMSFAALMQTGDPEITRILARAKAAQAMAEQSPLASIAGLAKWGAIILLGLMAWPVVRPMLQGNRK